MREYNRYKSKGKKILIFTVTILFLVYLALPVLASTIQELESQRQAAQERLNIAQYEVNQKQSTIDGIEQEIVNSNRIIESYDNEIRNLNRDIENINTQIIQTQAQLEEAIKKEAEQSDAINERLKIQYMYGTDGYAEALFSGDSITQQVENSQIVAEILKADEDLLSQLTENKNNITQAKSVLESQRAELNSKRAQLEENLKRQNDLRNQQQLLLDNNKSLIAKAKVEIQKEEQAIADASAQIVQLTKEADKNSINDTVSSVTNLVQTAKDHQSSIDSTLATVVQVSQDTNSSEIEKLKQQIEQIANTTKDQVSQLDQILKNTQNAKSAADAVEQSKGSDNLLAAIRGNEVSARELLVSVKELELAQRAEEEKKAQEELEKQKSEEAQRQAEEAQRKKEEVEQQLEEETTNLEEVVEEPVQETPVQSEPEPVVTRDNWKDDYISTTGWRWPLDNVFYITSLFGYRIHPIFGTGRGHEGVDIGASSGTPIHACDGGTVISAGSNGGYGNCVIIQQDSGHQVYYAHQSEIGVSKGQRVEKGDVIGYVGSTGWSTGPHLHLGVLEGGKFIDPFNFFPELN